MVNPSPGRQSAMTEPDQRLRQAPDRQRRRALGALALALPGTGIGFSQAPDPLPPRPRSLAPLLARTLSHHEPLVALFTRPDCPWCEALRREQLGHLAREAGARGVQVAEFEVTDTRGFEPAAPGSPGGAEAGRDAPAAWPKARSPADLAARLRVVITPTVVFLGRSGELADRLVGYPSRDFYAAYLDERIDRARSALKADRP